MLPALCGSWHSHSQTKGWSLRSDRRSSSVIATRNDEVAGLITVRPCGLRPQIPRVESLAEEAPRRDRSSGLARFGV
jgi:hypothetical protein